MLWQYGTLHMRQDNIRQGTCHVASVLGRCARSRIGVVHTLGYCQGLPNILGYGPWTNTRARDARSKKFWRLLSELQRLSNLTLVMFQHFLLLPKDEFSLVFWTFFRTEVGIWDRLESWGYFDFKIWFLGVAPWTWAFSLFLSLFFIPPVLTPSEKHLQGRGIRASSRQAMFVH